MCSIQPIEKPYDEARRLIQQAEREKRLVFFVGAGASIPSGMPSCGEAIDQIKARMDIAAQTDFLKIPQYYYLQYGKRDYTRLMRAVFLYQKYLKPNHIHEELFRFQVNTIITTNYDLLLEEQAKKSYRVVDVIRQDSDLAYEVAENKIIKMHGDFEHDNFVLKEEDYLNYSRNFPLIEACVKALIACNTILFIGYSFNDPDLKQIFAWVKAILGSDMPRAYMIVTDRPYSEAEANYFKDFGIVVLYASLMCQNLGQDVQLTNMLNFLRKEEAQSLTEKIYEALRPLQYMNYVHVRYIEKAFSAANIMLDNNRLVAMDKMGMDILDRLYFIGNKTEMLNRERMPDKERENYEEIYKIIAKSDVYWHVRDAENKIIKIKPNIDALPHIEEMLCAIVEYNMSALKSLKQKNEMFLAQNPVLYVEQAAISYHLGEFAEAYRYLQNATDACYRSEEYVWYFISLLNRKYLAQIVKWQISQPEEIKNVILDDADDIELDKTFYDLPDMGNEHNTFLHELYTFQVFYSSFFPVQKKAEEAQKESRISYSLFVKTPAIIELRQYIIENWLYLMENFILLDRYVEFSSGMKQYASILLTTMTAPRMEGREADSLGDGVGNIQPTMLDAIDIYFILRYLPMDDIKFILAQQEGGRISISDAGVSSLEHILSNIVNIDGVERSEMFEKILRLLYHSEQLPALLQAVLQALVDHVGNIRLRPMKSAITAFFAQASRCENFSGKESDSPQLLYVFIEQLLEAVTEKYTAFDEIGELLGCALYLRSKLVPGEFFKSKYVSALITANDLYILCALYPYVDADTKESIAHLAKEAVWDFSTLPDRPTLANITDLENSVGRTPTEHQLGLFCKLLIMKILQPDKETEEKLFAVLPMVPDDRGEVSPSTYEYVFSCITEAYLAHGFIEMEKMRALIMRSNIPSLVWVVDWENFDYSDFQCEWLADCSEELLRRMGANATVRARIQQVIREKYLTSQLKDNILKTYFQYFID